MPQTSTYFYPKLISGLIVNQIDPKEKILDDEHDSPAEAEESRKINH